ADNRWGRSHACNRPPCHLLVFTLPVVCTAATHRGGCIRLAQSCDPRAAILWSRRLCSICSLRGAHARAVRAPHSRSVVGQVVTARSISVLRRMGFRLRLSGGGAIPAASARGAADGLLAGWSQRVPVAHVPAKGVEQSRPVSQLRR